MRRKISQRFLILSVASLLVLVSTILAQVPLRFQYQRWPDRYEGIRSGHQVVGERLELVSVIARTRLSSSLYPNRLFVGFTADTNLNVSISVRYLEKNYWMEPTDKTGKRSFGAEPGFNSFGWDATDVRYFGGTAQDLYALVERFGGGDTSVLPAVLWDSNSAVPNDLLVNEYEFVFIPNVKADFSYQIRSNTGQILFADDAKGLPKLRVFRIPWNPTGQKDGAYQLTGSVTFHFEDGTASRPQPIHIEFAHVSTIHIQH